MRRRFLVESFAGGGAVVRGSGAHHLARVLRARPGQMYELSDGRSVWLAKVTVVDREAVEFALVEPVAGVLPAMEFTLLLSLFKFARLEWCLEKATELGAGAIRLVAAARSDRALVEASTRRMARWERMVREAAEQSRRVRPPVLAPPLGAARVFSAVEAETKILLSERPGAPALRSLLPAPPSSSVALAFGPEGGWTGEEVAAAEGAGYVEASLGPLILRAETAVVAAMAVVLSGWPPQ